MVEKLQIYFINFYTFGRFTNVLNFKLKFFKVKLAYKKMPIKQIFILFFKTIVWLKLSYFNISFLRMYFASDWILFFQFGGK